MIPGQLQLDLDAAMRDDLHARVRAEVTEPGMSEAEVDAAVADALDRLGLRSNGAARARPCICTSGPMLFVNALAVDRRCARCGRTPAR